MRRSGQIHRVDVSGDERDQPFLDSFLGAFVIRLHAQDAVRPGVEQADDGAERERPRG